MLPSSFVPTMIDYYSRYGGELPALLRPEQVQQQLDQIRECLEALESGVKGLFQTIVDPIRSCGEQIQKFGVINTLLAGGSSATLAAAITGQSKTVICALTTLGFLPGIVSTLLDLLVLAAFGVACYLIVQTVVRPIVKEILEAIRNPQVQTIVVQTTDHRNANDQLHQLLLKLHTLITEIRAASRSKAGSHYTQQSTLNHQLTPHGYEYGIPSNSKSTLDSESQVQDICEIEKQEQNIEQTASSFNNTYLVPFQNSVNQEFEALRNMLEQIKFQINALRAEDSNEGKELDGVKSQLATIKSSSQSENQKIYGYIDHLNTQTSDLEQKLTTQQETQKNSFEQLQTSFRQQESKLEGLTQNNLKLEDKIAKLTVSVETISGSVRKISELRKILEDFQEWKKFADQDLNVLRSNADEQNKKIASGLKQLNVGREKLVSTAQEENQAHSPPVNISHLADQVEEILVKIIQKHAPEFLRSPSTSVLPEQFS